MIYRLKQLPPCKRRDLCDPQIIVGVTLCSLTVVIKFFTLGIGELRAWTDAIVKKTTFVNNVIKIVII